MEPDMNPIATVHIDPDHSDEFSIMRVYARRDMVNYERKRPLLIRVRGAGWFPGSGVITSTWTPDPTSYLGMLYDAGWAIAFLSYPTLNQSLPNRGTFHPSFWARDGDALVIDPNTGDQRHMQRNIVMALQHIRHVGLAEVPDIDRRPGRIVIDGNSAGSVAASWVSFGVERANRNAADPLWRTSTEVMATVQHFHIASARAMPPAYQINHLEDAQGDVPGNNNQIADDVHGNCWPLRWSGARKKKPCYLSGDGTLNHAGPHDWAGFKNVLTGAQIHASDHVVATRNMPGHAPASVFVVGPKAVSYEQDVTKWVRRLEEATR
jgi:hypothetical protein